MHDIYLDNAATTRPLAELKQLYEEYTAGLWQNPSALYSPAVGVQSRLKDATNSLLSAFGSPLHRCFFTSCGTEGANSAILRGARNKKNMNYVVGGAEHPCVAESFRQLEEIGQEVRYIKPDSHGNISVHSVAEKIDENTALVSIMHVSNETGAKSDVCAIAAAVKAKNNNAIFHSDGVQAFLREPLTDASNIDYYTVSAHKVHSHKGTGAVFYKNSTPLKPFLVGGGQENGLRSGTQNTLGILSFSYVADYFTKHSKEHSELLTNLKKELLSGLSCIEDTQIISPDNENACSHILNISFEGVAGETLLHSLEAAGIYIATGSACSSKKGRNRIAQALSLSNSVAAGSVRISFSIFNTLDEIAILLDEIKKNVALLRKFKRF